MLNPAAGFGLTTLTLGLFAASVILGTWISLLLVRRTWSAHLSRRIGAARARALGMRARFIAQGGTLIGGLASGSLGRLHSGLLVKIYDPCVNHSSLYFLGRLDRLGQA